MSGSYASRFLWQIPFTLYFFAVFHTNLWHIFCKFCLRIQLTYLYFILSKCFYLTWFRFNTVISRILNVFVIILVPTYLWQVRKGNKSNHRYKLTSIEDVSVTVIIRYYQVDTSSEAWKNNRFNPCCASQNGDNVTNHANK